jgi:hypothetical protein
MFTRIVKWWNNPISEDKSKILFAKKFDHEIKHFRQQTNKQGMRYAIVNPNDFHELMCNINFRFDITKSMFFTNDVGPIAWCQDNGIKVYPWISGLEFELLYFENDIDAMAFKLKWT